MPKTSITKMALLVMSKRLAVVIFLSAVLGYLYNYQTLKKRTISELEKYISERLERESLVFEQTEQKLKFFAGELKKRIVQNKSKDQFYDLVKRRSDGTYKSASSRSSSETMTFIGFDTILTPAKKRIITNASSALAQYGHAWTTDLNNLWLTAPENILMMYWPARPDFLKKIPSIQNINVEEYAIIGQERHNASLAPKWTGIYLDKLSDQWLVSLNHPIQIEGYPLFSIGTDITATQILERTIKNKLFGTYNFIIRDDGRLIAHPYFMDEIQKEQGHFFVEGHTQKKIDEYYKIISSNKEGIVKSYDTNDAYVVSGVIKGPGWNLVTIYPKENMQSVAVETASFVGFMGLVSLIIELLILNHVLKKYVSSPISKLLSATNRFASGDLNSRVDLKNDDEIGSLAMAFNDMAQKVKQRDDLLSKQAHELEDLVNERTYELDQQRAKAYQAAKMATLGEMAGGIAHEINNPLAVIAAYAEKLKRRLPYAEDNQEQLKQGLETIERTVERISKIVKGMKSFSRSADTDPMKVVSLKSIIDETLVLCEEKVKSNQVKLTVNEIPNYNILCRDVQVIQSVLNLIQNAIDAISECETREIQVIFESIEKRVSIIVEDSGPGVPKELVEKIMNPFFTTKEVGKGTGLGLFISLGLIESNHGKLYLDTKSSKTRFIIELPFN